jgi:hypothetical protein
MSHPRDLPGIRYYRRMRRLALIPLFLLVNCSKSAGTQQKEKPDDTGGGDKIQVPGGKGGAAETGNTDPKQDDKRFKLQPEEGSLAIEAPAGAKAGSEAVAKVIITPASAYKVNTEFPTKLTLTTPEGVTIAKAELKAGGQDKAKGDAEVFEESNLTFAVKLTPGKAGSYTINGTFKFAVCDRAGSTCLAKKETVAIQVAAQ